MDRRIVSILGYDKIQDMIYGVARNRKSYVRCNIAKCVSITKGSWLMIRDISTTILVTEIAFVPETGHNFTDAPISVYKLTDNDGNIWGGTCFFIIWKVRYFKLFPVLYILNDKNVVIVIVIVISKTYTSILMQMRQSDWLSH